LEIKESLPAGRQGDDMLIEFGLLYVLGILFGMKENNHSRLALKDRPVFTDMLHPNL